MMNSTYKVFTPAGQFDAIFAEDEDIPIEYSGDELAISFFKDWLFVNQVSGEHGHLLDSQNLTPRELYGFCQRGGVIEVMPPFEDLLAYIQEDAANTVEDNDEQPQDENTMQANDIMVTDNSLDGVYTDADKEAIAATNQLIKYFRDFLASDFDKAKVPTSIYGWTATGQVMDKEDAKRRLRELIDVAINRKAGIEDITPKQKQRLIDYQHDARVISDYLTKRIRHTGARNMLRTPEMKAKFPEINNQPRDEFDSAIANDEVKNIGDATLDNISGIEKIKLIKEAGSIRSNLQTVQSGMEKLKMVKRIKEIRDALGVGGDGLDKNGLDADGMWPMTRAEYAKIHSDYKGTFPDGTPTALKLINGATSIVPVRITDEQPKAQEPEAKPQATIEDVNKVMPLLKQFIGKSQLSAIGTGIRGEEGQFFKDKLIEVANVIRTMPKTYGQDGMGDKAIAYLHYFKGGGDWHITEKDMEDEQLQAFGLADLGYGGELGYINIQELIDTGVELDLYWTPKTIREIKGLPDNEKDDPNIGREWNAVWGRQKIIGIFGGDLYEVKTIEDGVIRRYRMSEIERIITDDEYKLTPEYAKEVDEREEVNRLREERNKAAAEIAAKIDAEIAEFTRSKGMSPPNAGKARQALIAQVRYNGDQIISRKELIESLVAEGRTIEFTDGERTLTTPGSDTFMSENSTTKTGMDYAEYLISKGNDLAQESASPADPVKSGFIAELEALKTETDINRFDERLDEIVARVEQAGLMEALDKELNDAADVLTRLLSEAEKAS